MSGHELVDPAQRRIDFLVSRSPFRDPSGNTQHTQSDDERDSKHQPQCIAPNREVIMLPFTNPTKPPVKTPHSTAKTGGIPAFMAKATITPESAMFDAAERSIPPLMMIKVIPNAPRATITDCVATLLKFEIRRNLSCTSGIRENMTRTSKSPKNGAIQLIKCCILVFSLICSPGIFLLIIV